MQNSYCGNAWDCGVFNPLNCFEFSKEDCPGPFKPSEASRNLFIEHCIGKEFIDGKCGLCGKTKDENGAALKVAAVNDSVNACLNCWRDTVIPRRSEGARTQNRI